jgi:hypothetical protein
MEFSRRWQPQWKSGVLHEQLQGLNSPKVITYPVLITRSSNHLASKAKNYFLDKQFSSIHKTNE